MLLRNDLLHYPQQARTVRLLWIDPGQRHGYVFDVRAGSAEVERVPLARLQEELRSGLAQLLTSDPYLVLAHQSLLPPKHLALRARAWAIVETLVRSEPDIYDPRRRSALVAQVAERHSVSHPTVYRYLRRYWQRGQTPNALLPDYANSGAPGKVRAISAGVQRGRPRKPGAAPGLNVDEDIRRVFRVAVARYAAMHDSFSRRGAFRQMIGEFFRPRRIDPASGRIACDAPYCAAPVLPTFGQFNYWLEQDDDCPPQLRQRRVPSALRRGRVAHDQADRAGQLAQDALFARSFQPAPDRLPTPGSLATLASDPALAAQPLPGLGRPGASFYLEAVRADVQLVSRADRSQVLGRPLIYLAVDSFSRMVCGMYLSLEPLSWADALLALANCGADKQRYCQLHELAIEPALWPCQHLPQALQLHPALAAGWQGDALLNNFNLQPSVCATGPDDWKGVLERRFRLIDPTEAGGSAGGRLDGVLDLAQCQRIVIEAILHYNNHYRVDAAGGASPRALWERGQAERGASLKSYPEQLLRCCLMPAMAASVTADGILLHGSYYTCARAIDEAWFERARQRGQWQVMVAADANALDLIYLLDARNTMQFHACHPTERSQAHGPLAAAEIAALRGSGALSAVGVSAVVSVPAVPVAAINPPVYTGSVHHQAAFTV
ncbi:Mu transposase C-terminal domain-containing protein [Oxalobacteraceae bacterium]|nr:Mu transposase C-terminal domain-containing protein [Oxalobacteraceae bacterium]